MSSYSRILFQGPGVPLKPNAGGTRAMRKVVVCCCPWPGSDTGSKANAKMYVGNTSSTSTSTSSEKKMKPLPPGPSPLDLIGLSQYVIRSVPLLYAFKDLAEKYGPLMHLKLGEISLIVVSSPRVAKELLKTNGVACAYRPKTMASRIISYDFKDMVTSPYGEYWKQIRNICITELLSLKNIRSFEYIRRDEGESIVDSINSTRGAPFVLTEKIFWFMNATTCRAVFGNVSMDRAHTISIIRRSMAGAGNFELADLFPSIELLQRFTWSAHNLEKMKPEMDKILDDIIDQHRENLARTGKGYGELDTEDFVDVLLRLNESNQFPMTDDTIKAIICDMFAGGTESASSAVDWTMAELVRNPHVMARAQAEIRQAFGGGRKSIEESEIRNLKYLKLVVKESMRLHPPNVLFPRSSTEDMEIDGYHIPRNSFLLVNLWMLGRDPSHWRDPERFKPERFEGNPVDFLGHDFEFIPFGAGKRICPGLAFAVANVEYVLAHLLYFFDWKLPPGLAPADMDMTEGEGFAASRRASLDLVATPYASQICNSSSISNI